MVPGIALLMALAAAPVVHGCAVRNMHTNRGPLACLVSLRLITSESISLFLRERSRMHFCGRRR